MYMETRASRLPDLQCSGALSLLAHAGLLLLIGFAVTHSRAHFTPPEIHPIRLDVDLPAVTVSSAGTVAPSTSPVEAAVPQVAAPPRPVMTAHAEERLTLSGAPQDLAPAAPDSVELGSGPIGGVATFVATETIGKRFFGEETDNSLSGLSGHSTALGLAGGNDREGPISLRRDMKPVYPLVCRQRGEEGTVVLEATVLPDGRAGTVAVVTSSRYPELDRAATRAVERAAFNPATENSRAVEAQARITIVFKLTN